MSFEIKSHRDLTLVPIHILRNPDLSLEAKGAAAIMCSYEYLHCTETEIARLLGVSEDRVNALFRELQDAGYENIFIKSDYAKPHEKATERCAANLKNC